MVTRSPGIASTRVTRAVSVPARGLVVFSALIVALIVLVTPASAYWRTAGSGVGSGSTGTLAAPTGVSVPANSLPNVPVTWTASSGSPAPTGYYVTRTSGGTTVAACASSAGALLTGATSCTDSGVTDGAYTYRVIAAYRSWTAVSAAGGSVSVWTPAQLVFTNQPVNTLAGAGIPAVAVTVQTAGGIAVPLSLRSVTVAIGTNPAAGTLSGTVSATTNSSGVATFAGLSINKAAAGYTLAAISGSLSATSATFTITPAAAAKLVITTGPVSGTASAGSTLGPITVQERDAFDNVAVAPTGGTAVALTAPSTGHFAATSGGTGVTGVTIPAGSSTINFYYGDTIAGAPIVTVGGTLTGDSQSETIAAGTATKLAFAQQPTNTAKSATITPAVTVQIQDQFGNRTTTSGTTVSIAIGVNGGTILLGLGAGNLNGTQTASSALGLATFNNLRIDGGLLNAGGEGSGYTLVVTSTGLTAATSTTFSIT